MGADSRLRPKTRAYLAPLTKHNAISQDALLPSASQAICPCLSLPIGCLFPPFLSPSLTYNSLSSSTYLNFLGLSSKWEPSPQGRERGKVEIKTRA